MSKSSLERLFASKKTSRKMRVHLSRLPCRGQDCFSPLIKRIIDGKRPSQTSLTGMGIVPLNKEVLQSPMGSRGVFLREEGCGTDGGREDSGAVSICSSGTEKREVAVGCRCSACLASLDGSEGSRSHW